MSWYNPTSWFLDKGNVEAGAAADAKLDALNALDYGKKGDLYNRVAATDGRDAAEANLATVMANASTDATALTSKEAETDVNAAFVSGLGDAYTERTGQANALLNAPFKALWDSVPWYYWILGAGLVWWFYLGGAKTFRKVSASL